ncbi:MAG: hypothetical protein CMB77_05475 [Euryarchaeota archaeon]|nr:hypothetical protein [Euryarchaeota archaeon]|tara:strand:- start:385 stop:771 length:387 start_codon:yes stop_codon:yes gene_type:complete
MSFNPDDLLSTEDGMRFFSVVHMLQRSALISMGLLDNPSTDERMLDLPSAKEAIEVLRVLERKTRGNLDDKETRLLRGTISELQMQFVQAPSRFKEKSEEEEAIADLKNTFQDPSSGPVDVIIDDSEE